MNNLIEKAFRKVDRRDFVPERYKGEADLDIPLPIGFGQTISQPTTVKMMLEWLDVAPGNKVLDVGSGSGWTSALLSKIAGDEGEIYAVERLPELKELGQRNCQNAGIKNVKFYLADKNIFGLPEFGPYDRILVSASAGKLPQELIGQLKIGGKLVIPVQNSIYEITRKTESDIDTIEHYGFVFVPLIKD